MALTPKQERFVKEYLKDLNATQAAIRAGYSQKTAEKIGWENLRKPEIAEAIEAEKAKRAKQEDIDAAWVLKRWAAIADANITDVISWDQADEEMKASKDLTWAQSYALTEYESKETTKESEGGQAIFNNRHRKVKQADKLKALEMVAKHIGMLDSKMTIKTETPLDINLNDASDDELNQLFNKLVD